MANSDKPNILVIWGDDIGISNLSCYSHGLMGYKTPNIDRIAKEGMMFTDSYGEQSCTAGRSSFITGQSVLRTGLSKVGIPAAPIGMNDKLITIAAALKNQGYATGQFGKNHLGDLNHMLPTNHGFDESSATSITSMPRKSRRCTITIRRRTFPNSSRTSNCAA
jgi:arylsulfatase A-like enzyme